MVSMVEFAMWEVIQGTVLKLCLFVMYMSDVIKYVNKCKIPLFAEDALLCVEGEDINEVISMLNG